ncbi:hypothetical protein QTP88_003672 [Uroleucon formosanum]
MRSSELGPSSMLFKTSTSPMVVCTVRAAEGAGESASVDALPVLGPFQSALNVACKQVRSFRCRRLENAHYTGPVTLIVAPLVRMHTIWVKTRYGAEVNVDS